MLAAQHCWSPCRHAVALRRAPCRRIAGDVLLEGELVV
jgi:hypothetical protein